MFLIKEMPGSERPRERFMRHGKEAVSTPELIAIILRTGRHKQSVVDLARALYYEYESLKALNQLSVSELTKTPGVGSAKAVQLLAALELGKRLYEENFPPSMALNAPEAVYDYMRADLEMLTQEMFYALYLDTKGKLIKKERIFIGSLNSAVVHPREVFKFAVVLSAATIIIVHNHPSGDPTPSRSDERVTQTMVDTGRLMDIELLDHIIIGKGRYYSFKEHNHF